jgi:hypothetical protein
MLPSGCPIFTSIKIMNRRCPILYRAVNNYYHVTHVGSNGTIFIINPVSFGPFAPSSGIISIGIVE